MAEKINVNIIDIFQGPRHDRLRRIWNKIGTLPNIRLNWFQNSVGFTHGACLEIMWAEELRRPERYCLFTEADFLPNKNWLPLHKLTPERPIHAAEYCTRDPVTLQLRKHGIPGGWFVLIDKTNCPVDLQWDSINGKDPANDLPVHRTTFVNTLDALPLHWGVLMGPGDHLFWSRHLHSDPDLVVAGVRMGDVQRAHDKFVQLWRRTSFKEVTCPQPLTNAPTPAAESELKS